MYNNITKLFSESKKDDEIKIKKSPTFGMSAFAEKKIEAGTTLGLGFEKTSRGEIRKTKLGRYINHSPNPNVTIRKEGNKYYFIAKEDIKPDEELVVDYYEHNLEDVTKEIDRDMELMLQDPNERDIMEDKLNELIKWIEENEDDFIKDRLKLDLIKDHDDLTEYYRLIFTLNYRMVGMVGSFMVLQDKTILGAEIDRKSAFISIYLMPQFRGRGLGVKAAKLYTEEFVLDDVFVAIHRNNKPAVKAFEKDDDFIKGLESFRKKLVDYGVLDKKEILYVYHATPIDDPHKLMEEYTFELFGESVTFYAEAPEDEEEADEGEEVEEDVDVEDEDIGAEDEFEAELDMEEPEDEEKKDTINAKRERYLDKVFDNMYEKYNTLVEGLESIDTTKDKRVIMDNLGKRYNDLLNMLVEYHTNNDDPVSVQYQTMLEFRVLFIHLNNKLYTLKEILEDEYN